EDRRGRRAEGASLRTPDECIELLGEVEALLRLHEVVDEPDRQLTGRDTDPLVAVAVDDVVAPVRALDLTGLAASLVVTRLLLELEGHVLRDVPEPGALQHSLGEAAPDPPRAGVVVEPGEELEQALGEP